MIYSLFDLVYYYVIRIFFDREIGQKNSMTCENLLTQNKKPQISPINHIEHPHVQRGAKELTLFPFCRHIELEF